jgi:hypothetical protein
VNYSYIRVKVNKFTRQSGTFRHAFHTSAVTSRRTKVNPDYELENSNTSQYDNRPTIDENTTDDTGSANINELQAIENHKIGVDPSLDAMTRPVPGTKLLRMVREYQLKHPDRLLLTRVGDFYEVSIYVK